MSFSWWCKDEQGNDLFTEFGVHCQGFNLGPSTEGFTDAPNSVGDIRDIWTSVPFKEDFRPAAMMAVSSVQAAARMNKQSLERKHCGTCFCQPIKPSGWSVEAIDALLSIPLDRVYSAGGGW